MVHPRRRILDAPLPETAMRRMHSFALPLMLVLGGCATTGGSLATAEIPPDAVAATKVAPNGDEITEYRVAGQLRVVKVQPKRGPAYYLQDRNGDGRPDGDNISPVYFKLFGW
jgi:hypothetical protein